MASTAAAERTVTIRVLLVEDEMIHRVVARRLMKAVGGGVVLDEAENGAEAVRLVREGGAGAGAYDLILADRKMPVMDGHEATRQIRAMGVTTPIVRLSSDSLDADIDEFIKAGADEFTPKPLSKEKLNHIFPKFHLKPQEEMKPDPNQKSLGNAEIKIKPSTNKSIYRIRTGFLCPGSSNECVLVHWALGLVGKHDAQQSGLYFFLG